MKIINVNCPNCNAALDFDLDNTKTFCPYCGQKLMIDYEEMKQLYVEKENTKQELENTKQEKEKTKRVQLETDYKKKRLILIGIICVIAAAVAAYVLISSSTDKPSEQTSETKTAKDSVNLSAAGSTTSETDSSLSSKQLEQVTNPSEEFILERLSGIDHITDMDAVTEDNDPNGFLNKTGGYTSCVYFETDLLDQNEIYGNSIIEKGTDGGGCIEVYSTTKDANSRNEYLSAYDGPTAMSSGSHTVLGTIVIRTSRELTATQQKELEQSIYDSLIELK